MTDEAATGEIPCPTCDRMFETERGRNIHHTTVHGESLTREEATCDYCDEEFVVPAGGTGVYCSNECNHKAFQDRVELVCEQCGEAFDAEAAEADSRKYCSQACYGRSRENRVSKTCAACGRSFDVYPSASIEHCSRACMAEAKTSQPRPDDLDGLLWLLYVYEGLNLRETWLRANANRDDWLTKEDVRTRLHENEWMAPGGRPKYGDLSLEDVGLDEIPAEGDDTWRKYYQDREVADNAV